MAGYSAVSHSKVLLEPYQDWFGPADGDNTGCGKSSGWKIHLAPRPSMVEHGDIRHLWYCHVQLWQRGGQLGYQSRAIHFPLCCGWHSPRSPGELEPSRHLGSLPAVSTRQIACGGERSKAGARLIAAQSRYDVEWSDNFLGHGNPSRPSLHQPDALHRGRRLDAFLPRARRDVSRGGSREFVSLEKMVIKS